MEGRTEVVAVGWRRVKGLMGTGWRVREGCAARRLSDGTSEGNNLKAMQTDYTVIKWPYPTARSYKRNLPLITTQAETFSHAWFAHKGKRRVVLCASTSSCPPFLFAHHFFPSLLFAQTERPSWLSYPTGPTPFPASDWVCEWDFGCQWVGLIASWWYWIA